MVYNLNEVLLKTEDNIDIKINHYANDKDEVVIICPGWFMTKDSKSIKNLSKTLRSFCDVITMDFRGHGKSGGFYTFTANEEKDLAIVVEFAKRKYKKVSLMGFSLGGALVLLHSAKDSDIDKNIVVSAPADFYKIENHMYSPHAWYPTLFQKFEPKRWVSIRPGNPFLPKERPIDVIKNVKSPTLFLAGENDPTVFPWHTELLYNEAVCKKSYKLFENANHAEDLFNDYPMKFIKLCKKWLIED